MDPSKDVEDLTPDIDSEGIIMNESQSLLPVLSESLLIENLPVAIDNPDKEVEDLTPDLDSEGNILNESQSLLPVLSESLLIENLPVVFADDRCSHIFSQSIITTSENIAIGNAEASATSAGNFIIEFIDESVQISPANSMHQNDKTQRLVLLPLEHSTPTKSSASTTNMISFPDSLSIIEQTCTNQIPETSQNNHVNRELPSTSTIQVADDNLIAISATSTDTNQIPETSQNNHVNRELPSTSAIQVSDDNFIAISATSTDLSKSASTQEKGRKKRGRKRKHATQNRQIKKQKVNTNQTYINGKGVVVNKREFRGENFDCKCPKKCSENVDVGVRKTEFDKYWTSGNFASRCAIIQGNVTEKKVNRCYVKDKNSRRAFTRQYHINGISVCKKTFLNTYQVSQSRINTALTKKVKQSLTDNRGCSGGRNKTSTEKHEEVINFIKRFPRYKSHYCRAQSEVKYLAPNLNLLKLYDIYVEQHTNPVQLTTFKKIFYTNFNLRFKKPQKDTCLRCDKFQCNKLRATGEQLEQLEKEHKSHLDHAASLRKQMKEDLELAKSEPETETLTYDLQKTHNLPCSSTGILYYKRQLNFYNLGIHCGSSGKGYFHTWLEYEAGRGTQEVGSCLRKFVVEELKTTATHLILWADSCGGQNRSIKLVVMLLHLLLNHEKLQKITLRYLQPGHTFLPNDSEFGDVECALKTNFRLYTDLDYIKVMIECRRKNKFTVKKMHSSDFVSVAPLLKAITNRKQDTSKNKINWLNTFEIELRKDTPNLMYMKSRLSEAPKAVDLSKNKKSVDMERLKNITQPLLWPNGKELSAGKIKDLKDILNLIPDDCKDFYDFLNSVRSAEFEDDVDGIGRTVDFETEFDEDMTQE